MQDKAKQQGERVEIREPPECPECGGREWKIPGSPVALPGQSLDPQATMAVCCNCGHQATVASMIGESAATVPEEQAPGPCTCTYGCALCEYVAGSETSNDEVVGYAKREAQWVAKGKRAVYDATADISTTNYVMVASLLTHAATCFSKAMEERRCAQAVATWHSKDAP